MTLNLDKNRLNELKLFGLTELQGKIYVCTYLLGEVPVKKILDVCQIHKTEVYRVLKELEKLGAVKQIIAHPVKYRAKRPEEVLQNLLLQHIERLSLLGELKMEVLGWLNTLKSGNQVIAQDENGFEMLQGKVVLKRISEMLSRASSEIWYKCGEYKDIIKSGLLPLFNRAIERGVRAQGILNVSKQDIDFIKSLKDSRQIERRHNSDVYSWIVIVDEREMIFSSAPQALPDEPFLYTRNRRYIRHQIRSFEILFKDSIPIEDRIQELKEITPPLQYH